MAQQKSPALSCIAVALTACLAAPSAFSTTANASSGTSSAQDISGPNHESPDKQAAASTAKPPAKTTQLQRVVVTGTLVSTNPNDAAVPVTTLDADDLNQTGVSSDMLSTLSKSIPAFAGRSNAGASNAQNHNQFTAGGSQIELRNLPTLVLVDGQRMALDGVAGLSGSKNFVDISQIPAAALERVDVLTDGASSLYGADAVGGVVNFVLKHDYHGVTIGTHYGVADGGYHDAGRWEGAGAAHGNTILARAMSHPVTLPRLLLVPMRNRRWT